MIAALGVSGNEFGSMVIFIHVSLILKDVLASSWGESGQVSLGARKPSPPSLGNLDFVLLLRVDLLFLALLYLQPLLALPGDEEPAGQQDAEYQGVGISLQGVAHQLVEEEHGQHDQKQEEVGHVLGSAWHQGQHHTAGQLQRADDLPQQDRADAHLLKGGQGLSIAFICPFLKNKFKQGYTLLID